MSNHTTSLSFTLSQWYALSTELTAVQNWQCWAKSQFSPSQIPLENINVRTDTENRRTPFVFDKIPTMMRRRMSELSKLAVQVALTLIEQQQNQQCEIHYLIFASRHGELTRTSTLIENILKGEGASPIAFSQSVHNTAAGLTTIVSAQPIPLTSIAAGVDTFQQALIEAYAYLVENPNHNVLVVDFDQPLPSPYQEYEDQAFFDYACGFVLTGRSSITDVDGDKLNRYSITAKTENNFDLIQKNRLTEEKQPIALLPQSLQTLIHILNRHPHWSILGSRSTWLWECGYYEQNQPFSLYLEKKQ